MSAARGSSPGALPGVGLRVTGKRTERENQADTPAAALPHDTGLSSDSGDLCLRETDGRLDCWLTCRVTFHFLTSSLHQD